MSLKMSSVGQEVMFFARLDRYRNHPEEFENAALADVFAYEIAIREGRTPSPRAQQILDDAERRAR